MTLADRMMRQAQVALALLLDRALFLQAARFAAVGLVNTLVDSPGKNVVGNLTWNISPSVVNEVEFVYAQGTYNSTIASSQFATSPTLFKSMTNNWAYTDPYGRMPSVSITGIQGFSPGSAPWKERNLDQSMVCIDNAWVLI